MNSIAAVVVTFNRKALLSQQVSSVVEDQTLKVDEYYIIDNNSNDGTEDYINSITPKCALKITYIQLQENVGGAGGFYYGIKKAYEDGHDWIILMDDDGRPYDNNCFKAVFDYVSDNSLNPQEPYFINSLVLCDDNTLSFGLNHENIVTSIVQMSDQGIVKNLVNPFNGTFLSRGLVDKIGLPIKDFFIKGDEYNYTLRAVASGAIVFTLLSSRYFHPKQANVRNSKIFGRNVHLCIEAPWKEYYQVRNFTYTSLQMGRRIDIFYFYALHMYCALIFKCPKITTFHMITKGLCDGLRGKLGKRVNP